MAIDAAELEEQLRTPGRTPAEFDGLLELNDLEFQGPPPPPEFEDNGCGPKLNIKWDWLARFVAWLVPDERWGYSLRLPCRWHDFHWNLAILFRLARARRPGARVAIMDYARWLGLESNDLWSIEIRKADGDSYFRHNIRQYLAAQGAGAALRWRVSIAYWLGVRFGAGMGEA